MLLSPTPIDNGSLKYHYTNLVSHIAESTYTEDTSTPPQLAIDL